MDQDGSLAISFDEWRDYLLYAPSTDIIEIIHYWRHSTVSAWNLLLFV
jgi:solute carrier family 25 phosphate transporter 23/24/25/41